MYSSAVSILTPRAAEDLELVTGFTPVGITSVEELMRFVERSKRHYKGCPETQELYREIDAVVEHCLSQVVRPVVPLKICNA